MIQADTHLEKMDRRMTRRVQIYNIFFTKFLEEMANFIKNNRGG